MPYKVKNESDTFYNDVVSGGIEKFAKQLYAACPQIVPVLISKEARESKKTKRIIADAIEKHKPDMAISNDIDYTCSGFFQEYNIPLISIIHEPLDGDIRFVELGKRLIDIMSKGGHVYFVSKAQYEFHSNMCKRIHGSYLPPYTGIIPSSFCNTDLILSNSDEIVYDAGTIGRTDKLKDPFWIHRKLKKTNLTTCVVTDIFNGSGQNQVYAEKNMHWKHPQVTHRNIDRQSTMKMLSLFGCYVSTCPSESWGITAMEALGSGVPLILITNKSNRHSSEEIVASKDHAICLNKSLSDVDILSAMSSLKTLNRTQVAEMTRKKHSKENWHSLIHDMIQKRLDDKKITLTNFFD